MRRTAWRTRTWFAILVLTAVSATAADPPAEKFTLLSTDFVSGGRLPEAQAFNSFGCKGGNLSPQLSWAHAPAGTQSFALLMHDPDAPTGSGWWHWILYNIPAGTSSLPTGAGDTTKHLLPAGAAQGRTDFGTPGYGGPCPRPGKPHHYYFRLFALKVSQLELPADATAAFISFNVHQQSLGSAELMGIYGR